MRKFLICFQFVFLLGMIARSQDTLQCGHEQIPIDYDVWWDQLPEDCQERGFVSVNPAKFEGKDLKAYKRITDYMEDRGGVSFLQRLELKSVRMNNEAGRCDGIHFILKYHFRISKDYFYRFALHFDRKGRLISDHKFPDESDVSGFWNVISICDAVEEAVKIRKLRRPISGIELRYDEESGFFIWAILSRPLKSTEKDIRNKPTGDYIYEYQILPVNALTGDVMKMKTEEQLVKGGLKPRGY